MKKEFNNYEDFNAIADGMTESQCMDMIREYCEKFNRTDHEVYDMEMIDEFFNKPSDILTSWFYGYRYNPFNHEAREENNPNDEYFYFNGYGNICTIQRYYLCEYLKDLVEDMDWAKEYLIENDLYEEEDEE